MNIAYASGALFVTDSDGDSDSRAIRRVDLATFAVTTFAGLPGPGGSGSTDGVGKAARFRDPFGIASDGAGHLFVTDASDASLRKIDIATQRVTTLIAPPPDGGAVAAVRLQTPGGIVWDGAGHLYVSDWSNNIIVQVDSATGAMTLLAGTTGVAGSSDGIGTAATFSYPLGLALDGQGNLFVADMQNNTIRQIHIATAEVTTLVGMAGVYGHADGVGDAARFDLPWNIASDGKGGLVVLDSFCVRQVDVVSRTVSTFAGSLGEFGNVDGVGSAARFGGPSGLAFVGGDILYVTDQGNTTLRRVDLRTAEVTTVAGMPDVTGYADGVGTSAKFGYPASSATDGVGNLFVADPNNHVIRKVELATGTVSTFAGDPGSSDTRDGVGLNAHFHYPLTMTSDDAGDLYVTDAYDCVIRKVATATGEVTTIAGLPGNCGGQDGFGFAASFQTWCAGIVADHQGNLFVGDSGAIRKVVVATGQVTTMAGVQGVMGSLDGIGDQARFGPLGGLAIDGEGNILVQDDCTVRKVVPSTGLVTTVAGTSSLCGTDDGIGRAARLTAGMGLANDGKGNLLIAEWRTGLVRKFSFATTAVTTWVGVAGQNGVLLGPLPTSLNSPRGLAVGPAGETYILDEGAVLVVE